MEVVLILLIMLGGILFILWRQVRKSIESEGTDRMKMM